MMLNAIRGMLIAACLYTHDQPAMAVAQYVPGLLAC